MPSRRLESAADVPVGEAPRLPEEVIWRFGPFAILEVQRRVERLGEVVRLGPRSFDLLLELVRHAGEFVSNADLLSTVWSGLVVEEASVRVHVSLIRKSLGKPGDEDECSDWISNVPLRGYRFNGRVRREQGGASGRLGRARSPLVGLPARQAALFGRALEIGEIVGAVSRHRLVTIVGPGGIGKTSVAVFAAERFQCELGVQVGFVDLGPLISPEYVVGTISRSVGVAADLPDTVEAIVESLEGKDVLLLVDNCEHVIDALATTVGTLLGHLPGLRILATSRETLRLLGECVYRMPSLPVPASEHVPLGEAMASPAVELLVARAKSAGAVDFQETDGPFLTRICKQLEGMPLAIELAAARLRTQTPRALADRLEDHMRLLAIDSRGGVARHRSLAAVLDWSYALLEEHEAGLMLRLSVFRGRFSMESAVRTAGEGSDPEADYDALVSLVDKSMVMFEGEHAVAPYRLLDSTRAYVASRLARRADHDLYLQRHAEHMLELMESAAGELPRLSEAEWGERYSYLLDDVRFALENALDEKVDFNTAARLVTASAPLWFHVSQVTEYRDRLRAFLDLGGERPERDLEREVGLTTALIVALLHTDSLDRALGDACDRAIEGAVVLGQRVLEIQARWGRCTYDMFRGAYGEGLARGADLLLLAKDVADPAALNLAHRVNAMAHHFAGQFEASRIHSETSLRLSAAAGRTRTNMVGVDPVVAAKALLCRTLWISGEEEAALEAARDAVSRARATDHPVSLCAALYGACPVALWASDLPTAEAWIGEMVSEAKRQGLVGWLRYADWFRQGIQVARDGADGRFRREVSAALQGYEMPRREMLVTFCSAWLEGELLGRVLGGEELWCSAEVLRAAGLQQQNVGQHGQAEALFGRAVALARRQGAAGWEVRAIISQAQHLVALGREEQALRVVEDACARLPKAMPPSLHQFGDLGSRFSSSA